MSILKYKYKAHKFINYAFYVVVFVVGFIMGFGAKEINFNKLISQVLMIDSVEATTYTFPVNNSYKVTSTNYYNEEFLYNFFNYYANETGNLNLSFANYKYVYSLYNNSTHSRIFYCPSPREITRSDEFYFTDLSGCFGFDFTSNNVEVSDGYSRAGHSKSSYYLAATEDYSSVYGTKFKKLLDFSDYTLKLEFNENLFKNNPDFKEVCVDSSRYFVISSDTYVNDSTIFADFLWFPHGLYGLYQASYYTDSKEIKYQDEESSTYHYYFTNKDVIDENFSKDTGLKYLLYDNSYYKYDDRYLYYGWTAYPFTVSYSDSFISLPVYYFENPITYSSIGNNIHGGGGTRLEFDEELEENIEYCFYIKNNYHVEYLEVDEFNDYYGSITTPDGTIEINSSNNKNNILSGGLMTQVNNFINHLKDTINFIRDSIYEFYLALPLLVRLFLISVFVILIVKFIIGMVVR